MHHSGEVTSGYHTLRRSDHCRHQEAANYSKYVQILHFLFPPSLYLHSKESKYRRLQELDEPIKLGEHVHCHLLIISVMIMNDDSADATDLVPNESDNVPGVRVAASQETQGEASDLGNKTG